MKTKSDITKKCDVCRRKADIEKDHLHEGSLICAKCWPKYAEENGLCEDCGYELEPLYENNGFSMPEGPSHYEIVDYKPCSNCNYREE